METIYEIVREMREGVVARGWYEQTLREFADRIEAACRFNTVYRLQSRPEPKARWRTIGEPCNSLEDAEFLMASCWMLLSCGSKCEHRIVRRIETEWEVCSDGIAV